MLNRILMLMSLCALLYHTSCTSSNGEEHKESEAEFLVTTPVKMDTSITKDYVCQIRSTQHIELRALEKGYIQGIFVDEGQSVKKGQLMFQIMPKVYNAEVQKSKAEADVAEIEYQNTRSLADSNIVSKNELAMSKAKLEKAKAELALAKVHLGFTEIRAPFDGIMDRFHVREGSLVDEGELLTSLSDNRKVWAYFNVPEAEYLDYKSDVEAEDRSEVSLLMPNNKIFKFPGVVETIEADFNNETGNIAFRATFPNPDNLLRHGETGSVLLRVPLQNALLIPQKATFEVLDKKYVFVVNEDSVIQSREITVGAEMPHLFAVTKGLHENDKFLLEGLRLVRENQEIAYNVVNGDSAISHLDLYAE